jgi:hypothetical protein
MGYRYHFHFEKFTSEGWLVPSDFEDASGEFAWFHPTDGRFGLFRGKDALFPMDNNFPPEFERSRFYQWNAAAFTEWFQGWLPFEELILDSWEETSLLVSGRIPARYAPLFGDGQQPFPEEALLAGAPGDVYSKEGRCLVSNDSAEIADQPLDYTFGQARNHLERLQPEVFVKVTWKVTINQFLTWRAEAFHRVRQYGPDSELRIICYYS